MNKLIRQLCIIAIGILAAIWIGGCVAYLIRPEPQYTMEEVKPDGAYNATIQIWEVK